jgi:hypothetical protein
MVLYPPFGVASAVAWRLEIEWRGWAGLAWLDWFHRAVPLGLALFVACTLVVVRAAHAEWSCARLGAFALALAALSAAGHLWTKEVLFSVFFRVPSAAALAAMLRPAWENALRASALLLSLLGAPVALVVVAKAFGMKVGRARATLAIALYAAAVPPADALGPYGFGFVDAVKSGYPVPLLFVALGAVFWPRGRAAR